MGQVLSFLTLFRQTFANFRKNDPVRMAGATAFFAFFGLPPMVIILSQVFSTLLQDRQQTISVRLFGRLAEIFGPQSARQLKDISQHLQQDRTDPLLTTLSILILLISATSMFAIMKRSLNQLWNVKPKEDRSSLYILRDRLVFLALVLGSGLLFMGAIGIHQALNLLSAPPSGSDKIFLDTAHYVLSVVLLMIWFVMLFKVLPDSRIRWPAVWIGSLVTAVLFTFGELILNQLLTYSQLRSLYGTAGRITLVLLFVYYCSLIFYFGASFTRQYAKWIDMEIEPKTTAVGYSITEDDEQPKE
ncbi:YihY/virulence factor BrkB family protein [Nibrella saemangeumensis]|uniref:YihY/virulence factor BrkB family protein n=2 Tax=Nibrella saemangeumensis TaxID=1084526 RepID=A0ABP8N4V0_9BACT